MTLIGYVPDGVPLTVGCVLLLLQAGSRRVKAKNAVNVKRPSSQFRRRFLPDAKPRKAIPGTVNQIANSGPRHRVDAVLTGWAVVVKFKIVEPLP